MIWHLLEVWLLLAAAYLLGSIIGVLVYLGLERSPFAAVQSAVADAVGDWIDSLKTRYGIGPEWQVDVRRAAAQSRRAARGGYAGEAGRPVRRISDAAMPEDPLQAEDVHVQDELSFDDHSLEDWTDDAAMPRRPHEDDDFELDESEVNGSVVATVNGSGSAELPPFLDLPAMRPAGLPAPRNGVADDLQRIRGIGRRNEELLNSLGIFHFGQIAAWTPAEARWVAAFLAFPERIDRDDWIGQATVLASGGQTGYVKSRRKQADEES